jgi:P27 family predicted phage terminase small subunit
MGSQKGRKGIGGRPPKATATLKAEGGYRTERHDKRADTHVLPASLQSPKHLGEAGCDLWRRVVTSLPEALITNLDPDSLTQFCDLADSYAKIRPVFIADPIDKDIRIAYMAIIAAMDRLGRQFGWTPQSRASLQLPKAEDKEESAFGVLLARMSGKN